MELRFDKEQLLEYLKSFYALTHMRVVLFDDQSQEICSYPEEDSSFCRVVQNNLGLRKKCLESNKISFETCKKTNTFTLYTCHASLIEATAVLKNKGVILGYAIIGQCSSFKDKVKRYYEMNRLFKGRGYDISQYKKEIEQIRYKSQEQFQNAAKILETLVNYLLLENFIRLNKSKFLQELNDYLETHLNKKIEVNDLCKHFGYGRTKLYEVASMHLNMSVAKYITYFKMERAKDLLSDEHLKIIDVADALGFDDLNYFSKVFKKVTSMTPSEFREKRR